MFKSWSDDAWEDYLYWQKQDKKTLIRINKSSVAIYLHITADELMIKTE